MQSRGMAEYLMDKVRVGLMHEVLLEKGGALPGREITEGSSGGDLTPLKQALVNAFG